MPRRSFLLRFSPLIVFGAVLAVFLVLLLRYQRRPEILEISRLAASAGDIVELKGRFFGNDEEGAKLLIGGQVSTSAGIVEWDENRIAARVPRLDGAVLVKVKTRSGVSKGVVLGNTGRFPEVQFGPWLPGAPFAEYADPPFGSPGTLVALRGKGFGDRRGTGSVWMNRTDTASLLGTEKPNLEQYIEVTAFDLWSDSEIRFWVPEGVSSGSIYVRRGGNFSIPVPFEAVSGPGELSAGPGARWSLRQEVVVSRAGSFPGSNLYLRVPSPVAGTGQGEAATLTAMGGEGVKHLRTEGNTEVFRLAELRPGDVRRISRQLAVATAAVRAAVPAAANPDGIRPYDPNHPELRRALAADPWIRPDLVATAAARASGTAPDAWRKSRALYDYVINLLEWSDAPPSRAISDYFSTGLADSQGYSFLFCSLARAAKIPARPVGGIIADKTGTSRRWWWAEIWIEGLGWVPMDPALGDGVLPGTLFSGEANIRDYYFGGLDNRHIAFSRGILPAEPLQPNPATNIPAAPYSLQGVWEEVSGNLESYRSEWPVPRITAVYEDPPPGG